MITKQDLIEAIAECQGTRSPNANTAVKLAAFYTILDHLDDGEAPKQQSVSVDKASYNGHSFSNGQDIINCDISTDFGQMIDGKMQADVLPIMDELMTTVKTLNARLYDAVMRKLEKIE